MSKNSALLSIGAALLFSLFVVDGSHAFQIDGYQKASQPTKHVSSATIPCGGKTGASCRALSSQGSEALATAGSRYTNHVSNMPISCGGRTGASCRNDSPAGSGAMTTDGSQYTITMSASAAGVVFGAGLIVLVALGASRLRHHHGHHA